MRKKLLVLLLTLVVGLTGCNTVNHEVNENMPSMFVVVEQTSNWYVVYHRDTKVMYTISTGHYNFGNFTLMVDTEGNPLLWED